MGLQAVTVEHVEAMFADAVRSVRDDGRNDVVSSFDAVLEELRLQVQAMPGGDVAWRDFRNEATAKTRRLRTIVSQGSYTLNERPLTEYLVDPDGHLS